MIGIYELLNVGGKGIYEKYEEIYSSLWALSINVYRAVFDISRLVTLQVYRINVDLIKKKKKENWCTNATPSSFPLHNANKVL